MPIAETLSEIRSTLIVPKARRSLRARRRRRGGSRPGQLVTPPPNPLLQTPALTIPSERYLNITLTRENNITTGKIYQHVIERERRGDYLGKTVQVVPHLTDAVQDWIERVARIPVDDTNEEPDVCIIELGGTVGDIESGPFIEAMRQLRRRAGKDNFLQIHVSLVPVVNGEQKTKPTQAAIRDVKSAGLSPDLIACRCAEPLEKETTDKISRFCDVDPEQVIAVHDVASTYHVPLLLENQGLITHLRSIFRLDALSIAPSLIRKGVQTWHAWKSLTTSQEHLHQSVTIALVGKYTNLHDSYLSVVKSLEHSAMACSRKLNLVWIDASHLEESVRVSSPADFHTAWKDLCTAQGILVPGGFGLRGTAGMISAIRWAREKDVPFLGVCLGMQLAVIEYTRHVCGITKADSTEFDERTEDPMIINMPEISKTTLGGTMRLGLRNTIFQDGSEWSKLRKLYTKKADHLPNGNASPPHLTNGTVEHSNADTIPNGNSNGTTLNSSTANGPLVEGNRGSTSPPMIISERHRHRYEVNPARIDELTAAGLHFVGKDETGQRMEVVELKEHPWFVGVQFHPEYLSRVLAPSSKSCTRLADFFVADRVVEPYLGFVAASAGVLPEIMKRRRDSAGASLIVEGMEGVRI